MWFNIGRARRTFPTLPWVALRHTKQSTGRCGCRQAACVTPCLKRASAHEVSCHYHHRCGEQSTEITSTRQFAAVPRKMGGGQGYPLRHELPALPLPGERGRRQQERCLCGTVSPRQASRLCLVFCSLCLFRVSFGPLLFWFFFFWWLSVFAISKHTCFELGFGLLLWVMGWYCFQLIQNHKHFHHIQTVYTFFYNELVSLSLTAVRKHQRGKKKNK